MYSSTYLEFTYNTEDMEIWLKSHPQYGFLPYLTNQECYVSVRIFDAGISGRSLKLEVIDAQLRGTSYLSIRENNDFTSR